MLSISNITARDKGDNKAYAKYDSIQLMRGIAALSVLFVHILMFENGAFGVDLFFCVSGFIMMYTTEKSGRHFLQKRAVRLIPLYWIVTLFMGAILIIFPFVFRNSEFKIEFLLKSLFFIPYIYIGQNGATVNAMLQIGWTLILEVFFYIIFFISMKINHRYRHIISTVIFLLLIITGLTLKSDNVFIIFYCKPVILEFSLGMFSFKLLTCKRTSQIICTQLKKARNRRLQKPSIFIIVILAVIIWIGLFAIKYIPYLDELDRLIKFGLPTFIFFLIVFKICESKQIPRPFIILGDISYSLYLTHSFVVQGFSRLIYNIDDISSPGIILVIFVVLPLTIAIAWVSWFLIENKFTGWLRKKLNV